MLVIADDSADPAYAAADLLSQAEHDPFAAAIFVTDSAELAEKVNAELERQTALLPRRDTVDSVLNNSVDLCFLTHCICFSPHPEVKSI